MQVTRSIVANKEQVASSTEEPACWYVDMAHETRDGGKASARTLAAPVVTITKRRKNGHRRRRSRVGQNRPRATEQLLCVHAQEGQSARGVQPGKAPIEQTGTPEPV